MQDMTKSILHILGYLFGLLVLGFTGYQTWSLLYTVSGNAIVATLGLVLFEGGMLYWWSVFQREAEGLPQMGLSLLVAVFGLLLVGGATALHLGAIDADLFGQKTPARLTTIAAVVNLVAKFLMPLLHPDVLKTTYKKAITGKVLTQTFSQFETKVKEIAVNLADEVAEDWKEDVRQEILSLHMSRPRAALPAPATTADKTIADAGPPVTLSPQTGPPAFTIPVSVAGSPKASAVNGAAPAPFGPQPHSEP